VLYLALEDNTRRLQRRLQLQHWPADARATFYFAWKPLDHGGLGALQAEISDQRYRLIVIDTLSRAFSGTRNQNDIGEMTEVLGSLQRLALDHGGAILVHFQARL
jgi:AAA domain